jgi:hypothetical protein
MFVVEQEKLIESYDCTDASILQASCWGMPSIVCASLCSPYLVPAHILVVKQEVEMWMMSDEWA